MKSFNHGMEAYARR